MRTLGIVFMIIGIAMVGWFGYKYWTGMQSMTRISEDVVKHVDDDGVFASSKQKKDTEKETSSEFNKNAEDGQKKDEPANSTLDNPLKTLDFSSGEEIATL